jgi:hypothetical protein
LGVRFDSKVYPDEKTFQKKFVNVSATVIVAPQMAMQPFAKPHLDAINQHNQHVVQHAVIRDALANRHHDVLTCLFFAPTAQQQVKRLQDNGTITAAQARNILATPEFTRLLDINVLKVGDFTLMATHARMLLNEPESHTHVFKMLQRVSAADFAGMPDDKKIAVFKLPLETYEMAPGIDLSLMAYLNYQPQYRARIDAIALRMSGR